MKRGAFLTFEGIEGSGKSTQVARLAAFLAERGVPCTRTQEPGGTRLGAGIRGLLLERAERSAGTPDPAQEIDAIAELLLFNASRRQNLTAVIWPALAAGRVVLCDRYSDATRAYQGCGRGLDPATISRIDEIATDAFLPDLTLLLDLEAECGVARSRARLQTQGRSDLEGRFEAEELAFHERVRAGYLEMARQAPQRFRVIDASRGEDAVFVQVRAAAAQLVPALDIAVPARL